MPIISIIMPVYNSEKYIEKTLYSLTNQTLQDIEIICINDGSTDHSLKILQQHSAKDPRIKVFSQMNGKGPGQARNIGLRKATGKYLMFCDSDDWYERNMCKVLYDLIEGNSVDMVQCHTHLEREFNSTARKKMDWINSKYNGKYVLNIENFRKVNVVLWNKIWKKSLIDQYHISFPTIINHEDDAFCFSYLLVASSILFVQDQLYHYSIRENSLVEQKYNKKSQKMERIIVCEHCGNFLLQNALLQKNKEKFIQICERELSALSGIFSYREMLPMIERLEKYCHQKIDKNIFFTYISKRQIRSFLLEDGYKLKYIRYYILSKITWGKKRKHYKQKRNKLHEQVRQIHNRLKH